MGLMDFKDWDIKFKKKISLLLTICRKKVTPRLISKNANVNNQKVSIYRKHSIFLKIREVVKIYIN